MFEVYATRWDSPGIVSEIIPARDLTFSFPNSGHGEASFSATVEPGRSFWRASIGGTRSGILIAESQDNGPSVPIWAGRLKNEPQQGPRGFQFNAVEWGSGFDWFPAVVDEWDNVVDTTLVSDIVTRVQQVAGQNLSIAPLVVSPTSARSDLTVPTWDTRTAGDVLTELGNAEGGPEWWCGVTGSLRQPKRVYALAQTHGDQSGNAATLEYVEDTPEAQQPPSKPTMAMLGQLFPGQPPVWPTGRLGRRGGNVLSCQRTQDPEKSATRIVATGEGQEATQKRATATADNLLAAGWPLITRTVSFPDVSDLRTLQRHADAELAASAGLMTGYALVTRGSQPDWRKISRGSMVRVSLDTDVYAGPRPLNFTTRVLNKTIAAADDGGDELIRWDLANVLEVA